MTDVIWISVLSQKVVTKIVRQHQTPNKALQRHRNLLMSAARLTGLTRGIILSQISVGLGAKMLTSFGGSRTERYSSSLPSAKDYSVECDTFAVFYAGPC